MSLLFAQVQREAMAWSYEDGESRHDHPQVHSVRNAGYAGYVNMSPERAEDYHSGDDDEDKDGFDEDLWDEHSPEPTDEEDAHHEEHGEYPDSYYDRHEEAYNNAIDQRRQKAREEDRPDYEDDELMDFIGNHGTDKSFWKQHATHGPVDIKSNPVYATQSHVSQTHLDKYLSRPDASTKHDRGDDRYLGDAAPLMVTHNGRLHTIEGHHRVAAALQRGDHHINAWHFNADQHGGLPDEYGKMPGDENYEDYWEYH